MPIKSALLFIVAVFIGLATSPAYAGDIISCDSFESCPTLPTGEITALEARIEALEVLLAGTTRGIDPSTSQDTLTFGNSISGEAVLSRELSTTGREGNLPVCFNGAGELLPCADGVEPPPVGSLLGPWTGRMIYDRRSTGECHDADVLLNIAEWSDSRSPEYHWDIYSITVIRDSGGLAVAQNHTIRIRDTGYAEGSMWAFEGSIDVNFQFNTQGSATGYWNYGAGYHEDCYGTWSFTKD